MEKFQIRKATEKVAERFEVLSLVKRRIITLRQASQELGISYRHTLRLYKRYKLGRIMGLTFQRNHPAWNKTSKEIRESVIQMKEKYSDYNTLHLYDLFKEQYPHKNFCYSTFRNILISSKLYNSRIKKRRKPRKRFEKEKSGQLLQMDTSHHKWIPGIDRYFDFIFIIDDHSRKFLYTKIVDGDTTWNNLIALRKVVEKYGVFEALYTDNDSKFKYSRKNPSLYFEYNKNPDDVHTQVDMALNELRIQLLHTPVQDPESKGKVERPFGMFQDRIIKEFRDNNIRTLEESNEWLTKRAEQWNEGHIHWTTKERPNERFKRDSVFQPVPYGVNLDDVFCIRVERTLNRDSTFSYNSKIFQITRKDYRLYGRKPRLELHIIPGKKIRAFHMDNFIQEFSLNGKKKLANTRKARYKDEESDILA